MPRRAAAGSQLLFKFAGFQHLFHLTIELLAVDLGLSLGRSQTPLDAFLDVVHASGLCADLADGLDSLVGGLLALG